MVKISEVARSAGVSISTVSRIVNGKAKPFRISPATQARVLTVARQLGYQPDPVARDIALGKGAPARPKPNGGTTSVSSVFQPVDGTEPVPPKHLTGIVRRQIGLLLSATSPASSLGLIPSLEPTVAEAGYELVVISLPADTAAARKRASVFWQDGMAGLLCCPTLYQTVLTMLSATAPAGTPESWRKRVIVLWQGAGQAILLALKAGSGEKTEDRTITPPANLPAPSIPVSAVVAAASGELAEPIPPPTSLREVMRAGGGTDPEPVLTAPSTVVAAIPGGTDTEPSNPVPEPALTPAPVLAPAPEVAVTPTPDPEPIIPEPVQSAPVYTPPSAVVAAVPGGTDTEPITPVPEPALTPAPVLAPAPEFTVTPTPEPNPIIPDPVQSAPVYTPPSAVVAAASGELAEPIPIGTDTEPVLTAPSTVVAAVPGGTDTEPSTPVPEPALTPAPVSEPAPEVTVIPTPEPNPIIPDPVQSAPVYTPPSAVVAAVSVGTDTEPVLTAPSTVVAAIPGGTDPEPSIPVLEPAVTPAPIITPDPVLAPAPEITVTPTPDPNPIIPEPVQADPVFTPPSAVVAAASGEPAEPIPPESAPSMPDPTPTPPPSVTPVQEAEIPPQNPESVQAESGQNQPDG